MASLALVLLMLFSLSSCKKTGEESSSSSSSSSSASSSESEEESSIYLLDRLTGLYTLSQRGANKRPVAVMINNIDEALPQYGIGAADILFEIPVEGGITRMMGVYGDMYEIPDICSIRSCRYYYPIFALGFDAIYVHWGCEVNYAQKTLTSLGVDRVSCEVNYTGDLVGRDEQRIADGYAVEHTGKVYGKYFPIAFSDLGLRINLEEDAPKTVFAFNDPESPADLSSAKTSKINLAFSSSYFSTFKYNETEKVYYKEHSGDPQIDGVTGKQLSFTNVLALETTIGTLEGKLRSVDWKGGTGYCFSNGTYIEITWSKDDEYSPIKIFDKDGKEVTLNAGKTYIGIISSGKTEIGD